MTDSISQTDSLETGLDRFIPFIIYRIMAKAAATASVDYAAWGISVQEARVLMLISDRAGIRAGELSEAACVEASALSHMLRHLVAKQLISRQRDPAERRSVQIFLTEQGADVAHRCRTLSAGHEQALLAGLAGEDVAALRSTLGKMLANVDEQPPGESPWSDIIKPKAADR